jgi:hypothetical protein
MLIYKIFILILVLIIIGLLLYIFLSKKSTTDPINNILENSVLAQSSLAAKSNVCLNICPKIYSQMKIEKENKPIYEVSSDILPTAFTVFSRDKIIW